MYPNLSGRSEMVTPSTQPTPPGPLLAGTPQEILVYVVCPPT